jgi:ATP-binding cassette, subfamily B, bacterial
MSLAFANARSTTMGKIVDSLSNYLSIFSFAMFCKEKKDFESVLDIENKKQIISWRFAEFIRFIFDLLSGCMTLLLFIMSLYFWSKNIISVGDLVLVISLSSIVNFNIRDISRNLLTMMKKVGDINETLKIIFQPHEIIHKKGASDLSIIHGKIKIDTLTFGYDNEISLFTCLNFIIQPDQKVGLVGRSGAGKSTFIHLLMRHYNLQSGSISIDGQNIADVNRESLARNISFVPQESNLFHRSIMDNIRYGKYNATDDEVIIAAKKAYVHNFIITLPNGYNTLVGERGVKLSGGQKQRIALARVILKDAPILILDEATSALDSESEIYIQKSIEKMVKNKTVIAIAHRLSTLQKMDRILVMDDGKIIEDGSHNELLKSDTTYKNIWNMQASGFLVQK